MKLLNSSIFMPAENPNYSNDISCFVIYPGTNNLTNLQTDLENIRDWFTKYVVVVPDQSNVNWLALKDQIETHVAQVDYNVVDYSIGLYGDSTDIIDDLPSINPRNLVLFNPKLNDTISSSIKPLSGKKYFIYEKTKDKTLTKYITNIKSVSTSSYEMATASTAPINDFKSKLKAEVEKNLIKPSLRTLNDEAKKFDHKFDDVKDNMKIKLILEDMSDGNATPYDTDIVKVLYAGDQLKIKVSLDDTERRMADYQDSLKEDGDIYDYFQMDQYYEEKYSGMEEEEIERLEGLRLFEGQELLLGVPIVDNGFKNNVVTDPNNSRFDSVKLNSTYVNLSSGSGTIGSVLSNMIRLARTQVGYKAVVDMNLGKPHYNTKFAKEFGLNGSHWCGLFVDWVAKYSGLKISNTAKGGTFPNVSACPHGVKLFSEKGCYISNGGDVASRKSSTVIPEPGDIIFFNWEGGKSAQHVGIVVGVEGGKIRTIEGNTGGAGSGSCVNEQNRQKSFIIGYGKTARFLALGSV